MKKYVSIILSIIISVTMVTVRAENGSIEQDDVSVSAEISEIVSENEQESNTEIQETESDEEDAENEAEVTEETDLIAETEEPTIFETNEMMVDMQSTENIDSWESAANLNVLRADASLVKINGELYAVGGTGSTGYLGSIDKYDDSSNTWSHVTDIPGAVKGISVAAIMSKIYIIGGYDNNGYTNSVQVYDVSTDEWSLSSPMCKKRDQAAVMSMNNYIYVFGGRNEDGFVSSYEYCDVTSGKWNLVTTGFAQSMIRVGADAVYINGYVCIYGGINKDYCEAGLSLYEAFDMRNENLILDSGYNDISMACGADKALIFAWNPDIAAHDVYEMSISESGVSVERIEMPTSEYASRYTRHIIYNGYLYAMGGYYIEDRRYLGTVNRYSVYYGDYVIGDGTITSETTENGNSITLNVEAGREYMLFINAENIDDFNKYTFKVEYPYDSFSVIDACAMTAEKEIGTGTVNGTDISIIENTADGLEFISSEIVQPGETVTKPVNAIIIKANSSGLRTITYSLIKGE